jgi:hypothetical protein
MSGGFVWEDEFPEEALDACKRAGSWAFRWVIGYRASLVMGKPRDELRPAWDQLARECPEWPGFRPDRQRAEWKERLECANQEFLGSI